MREFNNLWFGTIIGILTSILSLIIYHYFKYESFEIVNTLDTLRYNKILFSRLLSIAGIPNLVIFFLFLNRHKYKTARGLILATLILALSVVIIRFWG